MAGTALSVGIVAVLAATTTGLACVGAAAVFSQRLAGVADAAALAAADAASGAVSGDPCDRAAELAATVSEVVVSSCGLDGLVATVVVSGRFLGFATSAAARAGPPP